MNRKDALNLCRAALTRALRTFAQTAAASIGVTAAFTQVDWGMVLSTASLAAVLSLLMSVGGLPELEES